MKLNYLWDKSYGMSEIEVRLNPKNQNLVKKLNLFLGDAEKLNVINPLNERKLSINYDEIYLIEAMDNFSKIYTIDENVFYAKGRLKDFENKKINKIARINNSTMLNLAEVVSFKQGTYARLEIQTKDGRTHIVNRHYAQKIKEALQCSKI